MSVRALAKDEHIARADSCPVCESERIRAVGSWGAHRLVGCRGCGLVYSLPRPSPDELAATYTPDYYARSEDSPIGYDDYRGEPEINARNMWEVVAPTLVERFPQPGRLLDVGCATGAFLARAREAGWSVTGLEISPACVQIARAEHGLNVWQGSLGESELESESFDVITFWHVLEHVVAPAADLAMARRALRPGGLLWIEMPNWNSVGRRIRGLRWAQIKPPEHINYFTPHSLRFAVEREGYEVVSLRTLYHRAMAEAYFHARGLPAHAFAPALARAADLLGWGGYIRLWARKTD